MKAFATLNSVHISFLSENLFPHFKIFLPIAANAIIAVE